LTVNDFVAVRDAFREAEAIKGEGVSLMEENPNFHGTAPTPAEVEMALREPQ
jgi:hypothetical protein